MKTSIYLGTDDCRLQTGVIIDGRIYGGSGADQIYLGRIHGDMCIAALDRPSSASAISAATTSSQAAAVQQAAVSAL